MSKKVIILYVQVGGRRNSTDPKWFFFSASYGQSRAEREQSFPQHQQHNPSDIVARSERFQEVPIYPLTCAKATYLLKASPNICRAYELQVLSMLPTQDIFKRVEKIQQVSLEKFRLKKLK